MSWGNALNQPYAQNMETPNNETLTVNGATTLNAATEVDAALTVTGLSTLTGGAFIAGGIEMEVDGDDYHIDINDVGSPLLIATNEEAGHVHIGKVDSQAFDDADVIVESPRLRIGTDSAAGGFIDANGDGALAGRPLQIGTTQFRTSSVVIGRTDLSVKVHAPLLVGDGAAAIGLIDADWDGAGTRPLGIGTQASTANVTIGRAGIAVAIADDLSVGDDLSILGDCDLAGALLVGPGGAAGTIDSGGSAVTPRGLSIGTTNVTSDVTIGRAGTDVIITDDLSVGGGLVLDGHVSGFGGNQIDFDDEVHTNEALFIEAGGQCEGEFTFTNAVNINGFLDIDAIARMNSNGLVLDGAANVVAGTGIVYSAAGHANPAIEFWTDGNLAGWMDVNGWHV